MGFVGAPTRTVNGMRLPVAALGGGAVVAWILRTGLWVDASPWNDTQLWKDA